MITAPISHEHSSDFSAGEDHYRIGDMALLQQAISRTMYADPHRAVVRELLCNARDAHREAGCPEVPVEIGFPTLLDPALTIADHGPGISAERMRRNFASFCASTKNRDNLQTGGFGLGCKTPFSVSDSFTVETVADDADGVRRHRVWSHAKNHQGLSVVSVLTEREAWSEDTGTTLRIPVSVDDAPKYRAAYDDICQWWEVPPAATGHRTAEYRDLPRWRGLPVSARPEDIKHSLVVLDGIPYQCPWGLPFECVLYFATGELPVTVTRDSLDAAAEMPVLLRVAEIRRHAEETPADSYADALQRQAWLRISRPYGLWDGTPHWDPGATVVVRYRNPRFRSTALDTVKRIWARRVLDGGRPEGKVVVSRTRLTAAQILDRLRDLPEDRQPQYFVSPRRSLAECEGALAALAAELGGIHVPRQEWLPVAVPRKRNLTPCWNVLTPRCARFRAVPARAAWVQHSGIEYAGDHTVFDLGHGVRLSRKRIHELHGLLPDARPFVAAVGDPADVPPEWETLYGVLVERWRADDLALSALRGIVHDSNLFDAMPLTAVPDGHPLDRVAEDYRAYRRLAHVHHRWSTIGAVLGILGPNHRHLDLDVPERVRALFSPVNARLLFLDPTSSLYV